MTPLLALAALAAVTMVCNNKTPFLTQDANANTTIALFGFHRTGKNLRFSFSTFNKTGTDRNGRYTMTMLSKFNFRGDERLVTPSCSGGCGEFRTYFTDFGGTAMTDSRAQSIHFGTVHFELPPQCERDERNVIGDEKPQQHQTLVSCAGPLFAHPNPTTNEKVVKNTATWLAELLQLPFQSKVVLYPHDARLLPLVLERVRERAPGVDISGIVVVNFSHAFYLKHNVAVPSDSASSNAAVHNYVAQTMLFQHCYNSYGEATEWMQFVDTDERYAGTIPLDELLRRHHGSDYIRLCKCDGNGIWSHGRDPKYILHSKRTFANLSTGPWVHAPYGYGIQWEEWTRYCVSKKGKRCSEDDEPHLDHSRVW